MIVAEFTFQGVVDGQAIYARKWSAEKTRTLDTTSDTSFVGMPKAIVQIAHGMAEHIGRYDTFAGMLVQNGFIVYGNDHRGHGKTAGAVERVGYAGEDGFERSVEDMHVLARLAREENPGLPLFLFGHSMGSFLSRRFIERYGGDLDGVVLSGTAGDPGLLGKAGVWLARLEMMRKGLASPSTLLNRLTFGGYNKGFKPAHTEFEWLSRDAMEVDKYIEDPYCGGVFSAGFFHDLARGLLRINSQEHFERVPKDLPMLLLAGDRDPVGNHAKGVLEVFGKYQKAGVIDVTYKIYPGSRHEILNERNRAKVYEDVVSWLEEQML